MLCFEIAQVDIVLVPKPSNRTSMRHCFHLRRKSQPKREKGKLFRCHKNVKKTQQSGIKSQITIFFAPLTQIHTPPFQAQSITEIVEEKTQDTGKNNGRNYHMAFTNKLSCSGFREILCPTLYDGHNAVICV